MTLIVTNYSLFALEVVASVTQKEYLQYTSVFRIFPKCIPKYEYILYTFVSKNFDTKRIILNIYVY